MTIVAAPGPCGGYPDTHRKNLQMSCSVLFSKGLTHQKPRCSMTNTYNAEQHEEGNDNHSLQG